jgi:hypothetical protein
MRWEYFVQTIDVTGFLTVGKVNPRELQDVMNHYGNQGWELVSIFDTSSSGGGSRYIVLTFKRSLPTLEPVMPLPPQ